MTWNIRPFSSTHRVLLVAAMLGWCLAAAAQQPLVACFNTYDCCVQKHGPGDCAQLHEGAVQRAAKKATDQARVGSAGDSSDPDVMQATAIHGDKLNSQLKHVARHLARILKLEEVGGQPPGEPHKEETKNHWWGEVKAGVKNIQQILKRCKSRKQILAALKNAEKPLTPVQLLDVEARLSQAALEMGETVGELLPCGKD